MERKDKLNQIIKKYNDLQKSGKYNLGELDLEKDREIKNLFKGVNSEMEIYANGQKYRYVIGYDVSNFYIFDKEGKKRIDVDAINWLLKSINGFEDLLKIWTCDRFCHFELDISKGECKDYEYRDEYFPCTDIKGMISIDCNFWNLNEKRKILSDLEVILK